MNDITLHPQHKKFCDEYLRTSKVGASAFAAGYSPKTGAASGSRLLRRPDVQQYLASRVSKANEEAETLASKVIQELKDLAFANIADFITVDKEGKPQVDFSAATPEQLKAISAVKSKTSRKYNAKGDHIATDVEAAFTLADKYRGLELLGKHVGLFKADEQRVVVDVADRLLTARRRLGAEYDDTGNARALGTE